MGGLPLETSGIFVAPSMIQTSTPLLLEFSEVEACLRSVGLGATVFSWGRGEIAIIAERKISFARILTIEIVKQNFLV
jgi:hypothetical protein